MKRGEIWLARLDPVEGSEQAGIRPVLVIQDNQINKMLRTVVVLPITSNLRWASFPFCVLVASGEGGLKNDSVVLTHQVRVLDKTRLTEKWGSLKKPSMEMVEQAMRVMSGM